MKIKIIGFKVGKSRPTASRTVDIGVPTWERDQLFLRLGTLVWDFIALRESDFISIRRVDDS